MHPQSCLYHCCQRRRPDRGSPIVFAPERMDLVVASHAPLGETRILLPHCLNVETGGLDCGRHLIKFPLLSYCGPSSRIENNQQFPHLGLTNQALPYSFSPGPRACGSAPELYLPAHSAPATLPCHQTLLYLATVHGQLSASTTREPDLVLPLFLAPLLPLLHSAAAALWLLSAGLLGEPLSPNCRCTDASYTTYATTKASSSLPPLPFFVILLVVLTHFHESSNSSDQCIDLVPRLLLRQMVCQILLPWDTPHLHSF